MMLDRIPSHDLAAEQAAIGAALLDASARRVLLSLLRKDDFYRAAHQQIWAMISVFDAGGQKVDLLTVQDGLSRVGELDGIGGPSYLRELESAVPSSANCEGYAAIIRRKAGQRRLMLIGMKLAEAAASNDDPAVAHHEALSALLSVDAAPRDSRPLKSVMKKLQDDQERGIVPEHFPTGLQPLDAMLGGGLRRGEMTIIAARPGMGKSSLAAFIARAVAESGRRVGFASLEMSDESLGARWLAAEMDTPLDVILKGTNVPMDRFVEASARLAEVGIVLQEARAVADVAGMVRSADMVVVDYIQIMDIPEGRDSVASRLGQVSRDLKRLARAQAVSLVVVAQLNRVSEERRNKRPMLAEIKASGDIEQDADNILLLYREAYYDHDKNYRDVDGYEPVEVLMAKQRNGPTGQVQGIKANLRTMRWMAW